MRGLFLKIFAIFWIAQSLIFVISTALIIRQRFPSPNIVSDALDSNLRHNAAAGLQAYESGGCASFANNAARYEPSGSALLDEHGQLICQTPNALSLAGLVPHFPDRVDGRQVNDHSVWLIPITSNTGIKYEYVWFQPASSIQRPQPPPLHRNPFFRFAFPQLPVAIAVGGVTTFVLVLLFTRPLVRLRKAARKLAAGDLATRVEESPTASASAHSDEFQGLVHDFNHMAERMESLVGAQKLLVRDVSHELRSPLARLSVALDLVREDAPRELDEHLARIEREAERLNQLIGQLLTLSSMETKEGASNFKPVSLNEICEQIAPDAEYEAKQRSCTVSLEQTSDCTIQGNWELLYRAIENVIRNAIRYTEPGTEVTIRITKTTADAKQFATVEVNDHGPGIPEAELANVFRPFYRLDSSRSTETGGYGVGLAITDRAVRLHGGTVRAINRAEGGISIQMTFPASSPAYREA